MFRTRYMVDRYMYMGCLSKQRPAAGLAVSQDANHVVAVHDVSGLPAS